MTRRLFSALLAVVAVAVSVAALGGRPATGDTQRTADYVVVAGVAGLRWDDIDPQTTPHLWRLAEGGSIGSLSVRSARQPTCPVDGWLTLGAGNYAAWDRPPAGGRCTGPDVVVEQPDGIGANLPDQQTTVLYNREKLPWGALPGALAESVRCTVAVGPGAAVAAARPFGRVDRYAAKLPRDPGPLLGSCVLSVVDLGTVQGADRVDRLEAARRADAALARVLAARPPRSLLLVAGLADTDTDPRLHVAIADGPGWERGWLTSGTTGREGYLQLVDVAPTALAALGRPVPERLFIGRAATRVGGRPADLATAVAQPADADRESRAQRHVGEGFFVALAVVQVLLALAVLPLLRRARRHAGPGGPPPVPARLVGLMELALVAGALAVPAALVADAVPWWRGSHAGWRFALVTVALVAVGTAAVRFAPGHRQTLGPLGAVAGLAAVAVAADVVTGARLQLNGVTGYSALEGGRYAGVGTVGLGMLVAGGLLAAGWLAQRVSRAWRPGVTVLVGVPAVIIVGSPYLGADPVGAIALTAGVSIAAAISSGGWMTLPRLTWAVLAGLAVTVGFAAIELRRPAEQRGSIGRFLDALGAGTSGLTVHRSGSANLETLLTSPLTILALLGAVLVWFALLQPWGGLMRLFGIYPAMRAAMTGITVASVLAGLLRGSALDVAGAAAALTVPMAALAALRVLDHAADRSRPAESSPLDPQGSQVAAVSPAAQVTEPAGPSPSSPSAVVAPGNPGPRTTGDPSRVDGSVTAGTRRDTGRRPVSERSPRASAEVAPG